MEASRKAQYHKRPRNIVAMKRINNRNGVAASAAVAAMKSVNKTAKETEKAQKAKQRHQYHQRRNAISEKQRRNHQIISR